MKTTIYEKNGQGNKATVRESAAGYIVETETRWQGSCTDTKTLIFFRASLPKGLDLSAHWNDNYENGEAIIRMAHDFRADRFDNTSGKILKIGRIVR